jgi:hypothetical protein
VEAPALNFNSRKENGVYRQIFLNRSFHFIVQRLDESAKTSIFKMSQN